MGLMAKDSGGGDYSPPPQGTHPAVCVAVIDLGTQYSPEYEKHSHKVLLGWELDAEPAREDSQPHMVWRRYTLSLHKKAGLRQTLEAWRGRQFTPEELAGFDLKNIAGKGCLITVTHVERDGRTYANIASVSALPKGLAAPSLSKEAVLFDIDNPDEAIFAAFSERLRETIRASAEWQDRTAATGAGGAGAVADESDEIPF